VTEEKGYEGEVDPMFVNITDMDNIPELHTVPAGEVKLRIIDGGKEFKYSEKKNLNYVIIRLELTEDPGALDVTHMFWIPDKDKMDEKEYIRSISGKTGMRPFYKAFDIDASSGIKFGDDLIGKEGWAIVKDVEDPEYGPSNKITRFVTGS